MMLRKIQVFFTSWNVTNSLFACMQSWGSRHVTALLTPALCECISLVAQIAISVLFLGFVQCNCTVLALILFQFL